MSRPLLLDLFCGAGGAAMGYSRAGFDIVGVDIEPQKKYPFDFIQADAVAFLRSDLSVFDAIHASPPCQRFSVMTQCRPGVAETFPDLIDPVRQLLKASGLPYVVENVPRAPLIDPVVLCGTSFGLRIRRHRLFEVNFEVPPLACRHDGYVMNPWNSKHGRRRMRELFGLPNGQQSAGWRAEMGVTWMTGHESEQAIPPAYTEYIGKYLMDAIAAPLAA